MVFDHGFLGQILEGASAESRKGSTLLAVEGLSVSVVEGGSGQSTTALTAMQIKVLSKMDF